ncbi:MAG: TA system VapC family ribonuclease toxin [Pseudomonadota bacterium]|nr:TA system VapC family ribonuclease toxin [Pseudomonadota bacterium]
MSAYLLDVNVLIALLDPAHINHEAAHHWFARIRKQNWATCPITENAVTRILSNPGYPSINWMPNEVMDHLDGFLTEEQGHIFWEDSISLQDESLFDRSMIRGHKQLTDIYLLGLAVRHQGKLATFDRSIPWKAVKEASKGSLAIPK